MYKIIDPDVMNNDTITLAVQTMIQIFLIVTISLSQVVSLIEKRQDPLDTMINVDFLQIYKKHFIAVRSLTFTVLQSDEPKSELNGVAAEIIKNMKMASRVQERFMKNRTAPSETVHPLNVTTSEEVPVQNYSTVANDEQLIKIKSLSSDRIVGRVIITWDVKTLLAFLDEDYHLVVPKARATYLLLLISTECSNFTKEVNYVLKLLWMKHGVSNIIAQASCDGTRIYTFHPFVKHGTSWGVTQHYTLEEVTDNFMLITNRFTNFHQFPLRVSLFERNPTAVKSLTKRLLTNPIYHDFSASGGFGGLDGCLLATLAKKLNFAAVVESSKDSYGRAYPNGTFSGTLAQLVNHKVHYSANGWFLTDYQTTEIEWTVPYSSDQVCAVAPKAMRIPPWKSLLYCFDGSSWIAIFLVCASCALIWHLLSPNKEFSVIFWEIYSILFGIPVKISPISNQYFFLASCLTFNVIIMGIIQGSFFTDFSTVVYYNDINTLEELDKSGLPIATSTWYLDYDTSDLMSRLRKKKVEKYEDSFQKAAFQRNVVVLYRKQDVEYIVKVKFLGKDGLPMLYVVNECLHSFLIVNMLQKGSPFLIIFNDLILRMFESGLTVKWYKDVIETGVREKLMELNQGQRMENVCTLEDVQLAFYVLLSGYLISALVFLHEAYAASRN